MRESSPRLILREKAAAEMQRPFCVEKVRLSFVQPLSLASLDSSPSRGASGEEEKFSALPKPPLGRGGGSASALTERLSPAEAHGQAPLRTTSQSRFARQGRVAAPSVCFAAARILLAAAPTAPPCFRHWRRSSPLPLVGEPLAKPFTLRGLPKPPLGRGGGTASAVTERLSSSPKGRAFD